MPLFQPKTLTSYASWVPTGSWTSNTTYTGFRRQVGDSVEYDVLVSVSGQPTNATLTINLPSGDVINTAKFTKAVAAAAALDHFDVTIIAAGVGYRGEVVYNDTTSVQIYALAISTHTGTVYTKYAGPVNRTVPATFASGDYIRLGFKVPIVGLAA